MSVSSISQAAAVDGAHVDLELLGQPHGSIFLWLSSVISSRLAAV
jgi:hypothetical protein